MTKTPIQWIVTILVIVGALNWGILGLSQLFGSSGWDLVTWLLGSIPVLKSLVFVVVGLAGVLAIVQVAQSCKSD